MSDFLKIEDAPGWIKDSKNNAILNSDLSSLQQYKMNKKKHIQVDSMQKEVRNLKIELSDIKSDVSDIKNLLFQIIKNTNK